MRPDCGFLKIMLQAVRRVSLKPQKFGANAVAFGLCASLPAMHERAATRDNIVVERDGGWREGIWADVFVDK